MSRSMSTASNAPSTSARRDPPPPPDLMLDTASVADTAPPPYSPEDPEPEAPPAVPPRDRARVAAAASRSQTSNRRASHEPTSRPAVSSSTSLRPPASNQDRSRRQSDSSVPNGQRRVLPLPERNGQSHPPRATHHRSSDSPPPTAPPTSGGFRVEMPTPPDPRQARTPRSPAPMFPEAVVVESPISEPRVRAPHQVPKRRPSREDPLELLKKYDTVFLVDDSASMEGALWYEAREALAGIVDVAGRYDLDGVDLYFLNSELKGKNLRTSAEVKRLFDRITPDGITPTGERLEELLLDYILRLEAAKTTKEAGAEDAVKKVKPVNFLVITDGEPTDDPESVIVQAARRLDVGNFPLSQVGIQFVQIGNDPGATEALKQLDDGLADAHGVRDMVDTVPFSGEGSQLTPDILTKILLGGINRRLDRRKPSIG